MTIQSIETVLLDLPYEIGGPKPLFAGKPRKRVMLLLRVKTDTLLHGLTPDQNPFQALV